MRLCRIALASAATVAATLAATGTASAEEPNAATCETKEVTVTGTDVPVMLQPAADAPRLFVAKHGEFFTCSEAKKGGEHSDCGASDSTAWITITDLKRFDAYIPSSCLADVHR
ncbi:MAG TPA: hypothetical protein VE172_21375 [Stackebrandtia sp.]|uniref:hypothetical protein n=1 Tax=Stackebrandtia sp. TaxID=2023065 RepID=UPI002D349EB3|nr:hypothetical protein [Stackebrandtia sp.]HZE41359.1 hypothetical protein [Stackebrandtia sp.]